MQVKTRIRGGRINVYLPHDIYQRVIKLTEQGAYASSVVTNSLRASLPEIEREMKKQTTSAKRNARTQEQD